MQDQMAAGACPTVASVTLTRANVEAIVSGLKSKQASRFESGSAASTVDSLTQGLSTGSIDTQPSSAADEAAFDERKERWNKRKEERQRRKSGGSGMAFEANRFHSDLGVQHGFLNNNPRQGSKLFQSDHGVHHGSFADLHSDPGAQHHKNERRAGEALELYRLSSIKFASSPCRHDATMDSKPATGTGSAGVPLSDQFGTDLSIDDISTMRPCFPQ